MIIGKDTYGKKINLNNQKENYVPITKQPFLKNNKIMQHSDITNKQEMKDKSFEILQERYQQGLITIEDFNKKCIELGKRK